MIDEGGQQPPKERTGEPGDTPGGEKGTGDISQGTARPRRSTGKAGAGLGKAVSTESIIKSEGNEVSKTQTLKRTAAVP